MKETKRTDRQELESLRVSLLRVSLARIAQALSVQTITKRVIGKDYGELAKLARTEERGWNALSGAIIDKLETMAQNNLYAVRAVADLAIDYLNDNGRTLKDVEHLLTAISSIVPLAARDAYMYAVAALSEPGIDSNIEAKAHLKTVRQIAEDSLRGF